MNTEFSLLDTPQGSLEFSDVKYVPKITEKDQLDMVWNEYLINKPEFLEYDVLSNNAVELAHNFRLWVEN